MGHPCFVIGNVARGEDFWDREAEIEAVWKALNKSHVLLKAPRRFGKTSIMFQVLEQPRDGCKVFFHDTEGMRDPEEFVSIIFAGLLADSTIRTFLRGASKKIDDLLSRIKIEVSSENMPDIRLGLKETLQSDWAEKGKELISHLRGYDGRVLFILDELPLLIQRIEKKKGAEIATDFCHWFRSVRQMPGLDHVRWLVGGSIGIEHVLEEVGAGTKAINDFEIVNIGPFTEPEGRAYVEALLRHEGYAETIDEPILSHLLGCIGAAVPYFIQILLRESLYFMTRQHLQTLTAPVIDQAYENGVLGPASKTYFEHYYSRLKDYYDPTIEAIAKRLLIEVARKGKIPRDDLYRLFTTVSTGQLSADHFGHLMAYLENDFYVTFDRKEVSYSFTTRLLRDWWLRYYDMVEVRDEPV